jgi:hypothetical protein
MRRMFFALGLCLAGATAQAQDFVPVTEKSEFLEVLSGRELELRLFKIRLDVQPDGQIAGSALGWDVTGSWDWKDGYFCREMDWSGYDIPMNCQLVEVRGTSEMRFTVDQGAGDSASFRLR